MQAEPLLSVVPPEASSDRRSTFQLLSVSLQPNSPGDRQQNSVAVHAQRIPEALSEGLEAVQGLLSWDQPVCHGRFSAQGEARCHGVHGRGANPAVERGGEQRAAATSGRGVFGRFYYVNNGAGRELPTRGRTTTPSVPRGGPPPLRMRNSWKLPGGARGARWVEDGQSARRHFVARERGLRACVRRRVVAVSAVPEACGSWAAPWARTSGEWRWARRGAGGGLSVERGLSSARRSRSVSRTERSGRYGSIVEREDRDERESRSRRRDDYKRSSEERRGDRYDDYRDYDSRDYDSRDYDSRDSRDCRDYDSRDYDSRDSRDCRDYDSRDGRDCRDYDSRDCRDYDSRDSRDYDCRDYDSRDCRDYDSRDSRDYDSRDYDRDYDSRDYDSPEVSAAGPAGRGWEPGLGVAAGY